MRYIFTAAIATLLVIAALLALPPIGETDSTLAPQTAGDRLAVASQDDGAGGDSASLSGAVNSSARAVVSPDDVEPLVLAEVLGEVQTEQSLSNLIDGASTATTAVISSSSSTATATAAETDRSLSVDEPVAPAPVAPAPTTAAPTTTVAPATAPTTTAALTTTAAPTTTTTAAPTTTTTTTTTAVPTTTTTTTAAPVFTPVSAAPSTTVAPSSQLDTGSNGVVISPNGVVLPIIAPAADGQYRASTPCGNEVTIGGERIGTVDFVLDAGHGGSEPGAVGYNGATEKALNLRIAEIVEWYLEEAGYTVLQTRTTDIRLPLQSRAAIAIAASPRAFVSIHHNGGAVNHQDTPGSELFVDGGNPEARRLGGLMFEEMIDHISPYEADWVGGWRNGVGTRLNSSGADLYGIHRFTPGIPSVITEVGYLSNPSEADLFVNNEFQWSHAKSIADALIRWTTTADEGTGYLDDFVDDSSSGTGGFSNCVDPTL